MEQSPASLRFPVAPCQLTGEWVERQLRKLHGERSLRIAQLAIEPIGTGQVGDSVRIRIETDHARSARTDDPWPRSLAAKFAARDPTSRATAALLGLYRREVGFYRELAPLPGVRTPRVYAAHWDEPSGSFVLLFEDLAPARGGDQLAGCTLDDARHAIVQASALHAASWDNRVMLDKVWLESNQAGASRVRALYPKAQAVFRQRYEGALEADFMALCEALAASEAWASRQPARRCLVHGDFRLDNMMFDILGGAEPIAILDWQTLATGDGLSDIGYFLGAGIGNALRRAHEDELLELYRDQMARRGVMLTREEIRRGVAIGALTGIATAVFSAAFVERTERGDATFLSMARGACALALEHDSLALLGDGAQ